MCVCVFVVCVCMCVRVCDAPYLDGVDGGGPDVAELAVEGLEVEERGEVSQRHEGHDEHPRRDVGRQHQEGHGDVDLCVCVCVCVRVRASMRLSVCIM